MTGLQSAFHGVRSALDGAGVPFAIGGSWASTAHGEPRQTNDIDLVAGFDPNSLVAFLELLGADYYFDQQTALQAFQMGRPFNVIHIRLAFKFDLFPARDEYDAAELERRQPIPIPGLDDEPVPVVSAEDIVLAKLRWYLQGGEASTQQWRDIVGVLRSEGSRLDAAYLERWASRLGVLHQYSRAWDEVAGDSHLQPPVR